MPEELLQAVQALGPWHMNIKLAPDVRTGIEGNSGNPDRARHKMSVINPAELRPLLKQLYPKGMDGKRFLDCACNAGGYCFVASDLGADYCFGFDVREHWIEQARFLKRHLGKTDDRARFEVCDLFDVGQRLGDERFDV